MSSLLQLLLAMTACVIIAVRFTGLPRIFSLLAGGLWLLTGAIFIFRFYIGGLIWSSVDAIGWAFLVVALATIPTRGDTTLAPASASPVPFSPASSYYPQAAASTGMPFCLPISKPFFLGSLIGSAAGVTLFSAMAAVAMDSGGKDEAVDVLVVLIVVLCIYLTIVMAVFLHKLWSAIQAGSPRTTPGRAVGFLFIPLFNCYWIFQAFWGWTRDFNSFVATKSLRAPRMPEGLALAICILAIVSIIPIVGILCGVVNIVLMSIFASDACDGVNALASPASLTQPAAV
jgi:hypothetical protein